MRTCRSRLGAYIWDERSKKGIKRTKLARMIGCERESIVMLEDRGDDIEGILPKVIEVLSLDPKIIEQRLADDRQIRLDWLKWCGQPDKPVILAARKPISCPVNIPNAVVRAGNETIEAYARDFARDWNRTIELFVRNHVRFIISPSGEIDINELGFYEPWLDEMVEL
ncbi:hypothetical protein Spb1_22150 [Planctopirus ephydatiae]|uniref:Uncharacterized protein n=1 Tax=Planctopirus ephydatiae TaxID=2528019 RepID=A0A518GNX9_9PLAN|nr:hypothetical protein [Planctopirus ephydatiae]QDV30286.1 hypothetical protein Spb1_22150 [Planctopirus ephydatiae]